MIRLERTLDYELIRSIMTHPQVYPHIADDFMPPPENFWPLESPALFRLLAYDGDELLGLFVTHQINGVLWEVDHCLLPNSWGRRARAAGKAFLAWLWENTAAQKVIGFTPASNRLAVRYALGLGLRELGRIPGATQRSFVLIDLVIVGKDRPKKEN